MEYYIVLILIILLVWLITKLLKFKNADKVFLNITFILLFLFLALRAETIGTDLLNYKKFFNMCQYKPYSKLIKMYEPGFAAYTYFIKNILKGNFQTYLVITAFSSLIGVYFFIKDNSNNYLISIIIYICLSYYLFIFSGLRQAIALSIAMFSFRYIKDKKLIKYLIFVLLATSFHKSAIIILPIYFFDRIRINKRDTPLILFVFLLTFICRFQIISIFKSNFYNQYLLLDNSNEGFKLLAVYLLLWIFITIYKDIFNNNISNRNLWYNMFCVGIVIQILSTVEGNAYRASYYYVISLMNIFPSLINCFVKKQRIVISLTFCFLLVMYYTYTLNNSTLVNSYHFFWK